MKNLCILQGSVVTFFGNAKIGGLDIAGLDNGGLDIDGLNNDGLMCVGNRTELAKCHYLRRFSLRVFV